MRIEKQLEPFIIKMNENIETAMVHIELNHFRSLIVIDSNNVVVGSLSDGDIRRAFLNHRLPTTPVHQIMNTNFICVGEGEEDKTEKIFNNPKNNILLIPVTDKTGRLIHILCAY